MATAWLLVSLQSLTEQSQAMLVRVLQLCAAHAALLHGGPLLEQATWMQLQKAFRLAVMIRHAIVCEAYPCTLSLAPEFVDRLLLALYMQSYLEGSTAAEQRCV